MALHEYRRIWKSNGIIFRCSGISTANAVTRVRHQYLNCRSAIFSRPNSQHSSRVVIIPRHKNSALRTYITANSAGRYTVDPVSDHKRPRKQLLKQGITGLSGFGNGMFRKIVIPGSARVSYCFNRKNNGIRKKQIDDTNPGLFHR